VPPDSVQAAIAAGVAAVVCAALTAALWDRWGRGWRWPMRVVGVVLGAIVAVAATGVSVNRVMELYTSWSEVFGSRPASAAEDVRAAIESTARTRTGSQVVSFAVAGHASGIRLTAYAYLPAGYNSGMRYPVVEALDGYPGSPLSWLHRLRVRSVLDQEIAAGRMAPTVVVFPYQTPNPLHDTECVDAVRGTRADTFLTVDVRAEVARLFRVRTDRAGWGLIGYSTGGFCAANLGLRHPDLYAAAASLSGYFQARTDATTGDLYRGNSAVRDENSPLWRMTHVAQPDLALYLACARDDVGAYRNIQQMLGVTRLPALMTTAVVPRGGHTPTAWRPLEAPAFDWLSSRLAAPETVAIGP
jgi:enterochelin esterase-like enzyme